MKKLIVSLFVLGSALALLSSCGGKMSARNYNETIVALHTQSWDYLNPRMEQIYDYKTTSKEQSKLIIDSLNTKFDGYIKRLSEMKYPDKAELMHQAATNLFVFVKDSVIPLYSETLNYEPDTKDWYNVWNEIDHRLKGRADQLEDRMIKEQADFANAMGQELR